MTRFEKFYRFQARLINWSFCLFSMKITPVKDCPLHETCVKTNNSKSSKLWPICNQSTWKWCTYTQDASYYAMIKRICIPEWSHRSIMDIPSDYCAVKQVYSLCGVAPLSVTVEICRRKAWQTGFDANFLWWAKFWRNCEWKLTNNKVLSNRRAIFDRRKLCRTEPWLKTDGEALSDWKASLRQRTKFCQMLYHKLQRRAKLCWNVRKFQGNKWSCCAYSMLS